MRPCWEADNPGKSISDEDLAKLPSIERNRLLRAHPFVAADHFVRRVNCMLRLIKKHKLLGNVTEQFVRFEWQVQLFSYHSVPIVDQK